MAGTGVEAVVSLRDAFYAFIVDTTAAAPAPPTLSGTPTVFFSQFTKTLPAILATDDKLEDNFKIVYRIVQDALCNFVDISKTGARLGEERRAALRLRDHFYKRLARIGNPKPWTPLQWYTVVATSGSTSLIQWLDDAHERLTYLAPTSLGTDLIEYIVQSIHGTLQASIGEFPGVSRDWTLLTIENVTSLVRHVLHVEL